jgi:hypothetical protein
MNTWRISVNTNLFENSTVSIIIAESDILPSVSINSGSQISYVDNQILSWQIIYVAAESIHHMHFLLLELIRVILQNSWDVFCAGSSAVLLGCLMIGGVKFWL